MIDEELETEVIEEVEPEEVETEEETKEEPETDGRYVETEDPKIKARFAKLTRERTAERQAREAAEARAKQYEQELAALKAPKPVDAPDPDLSVTDPAEYTRQQNRYAEYIRAQAVQEQEQKRLESEKEANEKLSIRQKQDAYFTRAAELKIDKAKLMEAGKVVGESGLKADVIAYLLEHEDGPAIVQKLADDPEKLDSLIGLSPIKAAAMIERSYSIPARKRTDPPPPPKKVAGSRQSGQSLNDWEIK